MVLGECSGWLAGLGYSPGSAAAVVNVLERLSWWMQLVGVEVDDIDEDLLARFLEVEGSRDLPCATVKRWIGTIRRFLMAAGYLNSAGVQRFTHAGEVRGGGLVFVDAAAARTD
ncbi:hypothetical protein TUM20985_39390 [Mycobacterium antarcticum]|nr:hypothetical protein TUM20985_39390 [Mycolicibacterium sp. TUM20985]